MKSILLIVLALCFFTSCQLDNYEKSSGQQTEKFLTADIDQKYEVSFIASNTDKVNKASWLSENMSLAMNIDPDYTLAQSIGSLDDLLQPLLQKSHPTELDKYDIEQLVNSGYRYFLETSPTSTLKTTTAAKYLEQIFTHSTPIDLHLLTDLFRDASPALSQNDQKKFRKYILRTANNYLKQHLPGDMPESRYDLLQWQADYATKALAAKK